MGEKERNDYFYVCALIEYIASLWEQEITAIYFIRVV